MHAFRGMQHKRLPRPLQQRDPSLITIPLPVEKIPILGPLLSPLIAGPSSTTTKSTSTPTPTPTSTPATTPSSSTRTTTNSTPTTGPGSTSNTSTGATTSNPDSTSTTTSASSASTDSTPGSSSQNPTGPPSSAPTGLSPPPANAAGDPPADEDFGSSTIIPNSQAFVTSGTSGNNPQETGTGTRSGVESTGTLSGTTRAPTQGTTVGTGNIGSSTITPTGQDPSSPSGEATGASSRGGVSPGIIAAICSIVLLLLILLVLCCVRRRAIVTRLRRRKQWFAGAARIHDLDEKDVGSGTKSARSSFATSFDRGQLFVNPVPEMSFETAVAPMMQTWTTDLNGSPLSAITVPLASHSVSSVSSPTIRNSPDRSSIHSNSSGGGSRPNSLSSQHLVAVPQMAAAKESPSSPFFVRPFSPSETWSFPKPPNASDVESRAASQILTGSIKSSPFFSAEEQEQLAAAENENPFADFTEVRPHTPSTDDSAGAHFAPIEVIRRPFVPSMDDEMGVRPGELVRILKRFDDGWALAEKIGVGPQGLIPIDCLRAPEEDLPAFLAKKRISSYRARSSVITRASVLSGTSSVGAAM